MANREGGRRLALRASRRPQLELWLGLVRHYSWTAFPFKNWPTGCAETFLKTTSLRCVKWKNNEGLTRRIRFCWVVVAMLFLLTYNSPNTSLPNDQLDALFIYLFISSLYVFPASQSSSSGDRIVLIHHLVWLVCLSDWLVCWSGGNLLTGIPSSLLD